jgi:hypothetical protein
MDDMTEHPTRLRPLTLVLFSVLALAALLRLWGLTSFPLMQDELYTLHDATDFWNDPKYSRPLYYIVQNLLLRLDLPTILLLRVPPFLFGLLGVWVTWKLGRRWFGSVAGLVAAFLVAVSPWHVFASQFARYWSLVYVLVALLYLILPVALERDRAGGYLAVLATIVAAGLSHPTALFPLPGILVAVLLVSDGGRLGWRWPTKNAWLYLWGPLVICAIGGFIAARTFGVYSGVPQGRGPQATLRLVFAMVQWLSPVVVVAAALAVVLLARRPSDRRPAAIAIFGVASAVAALLLASTRAATYADYGIAVLPLVYVTIGGAVQRTADMVPSVSRALACGLTLIIATGAAPELASHLVDGTRFDFRPALAYIQRSAPERLVLTWPTVEALYYAPQLQIRGLRLNPNFLETTLEATDGFWLLTRHRRYGLVDPRPGARAWIGDHCRTVLTTEKLRFDFRVYRVELAWCGGDRPPEAPASAVEP